MDLKALTDADIAALVKQHPLPSGVYDCVINPVEFGEAIYLNRAGVDRLVWSGMPLSIERENGLSYNLQFSHDRPPFWKENGVGSPCQVHLSHCWAWWKASTAARRQEKSEQDFHGPQSAD